MLTGSQIPQNDDWPEEWSRFLEKAAKGSIKACDILTYAHWAYMVALTGETDAPDTLLPAQYDVLMEQFIASRGRSETRFDLLSKATNAGWFEFNGHLQTSSIHPNEHYGSLWSRKCCVAKDELIHDALHHCCARWSSSWLLQVIRDENSRTYNSLEVVAAMLMLAATWRAE